MSRAADPDGYTILLTPGGSLTTGPAVHKNIGYDPVKAFAPVALLIEHAADPHACIRTLPVKTVPELVAYAKANPGKLVLRARRASAPGRICSLELFKLETGVNIVHVPYRGTAPMLTAIARRRNPDRRRLASTTILPHIQSRQCCARSPSTSERAPSEIARSCPPWRRSAFPKLQAPFWLGVVAPAGTPPDIVDKLNAAFRESLDAAGDARSGSATLGADIAIGTPGSSARCSPRSSRCGPASRRPPISQMD